MMYMLIGEKLGHSYSKYIHALLGDYEYELMSLSPEELPAFIKKGDFEGLNVTIPYKKEVMKYLDHLSPEAEKIGSVNTIVRKNGSLTGYNTDYFGFLYAAGRAKISFAGKKVIVLGSGGAGSAVRAAARDKGAEDIYIVSRKGSLNYSNIYDLQDAEIVINATPVGTYPDTSAEITDVSRFPRCSGIIDLIYNPLKTPLIQEGERLGIRCSGGLPMLAAQAKYASDIFTGKKRDDGIIGTLIETILGKVRNIALIGMPGCGKSSVGRILADKTGKIFVDTDAEIEKSAGKTIPDIFRDEGEEKFRDIETEIISKFGKEKGQVISTGGGAVLRKENIAALRQNGVLIFIERDISKLPVSGRPLSGPMTLGQMYEKRSPLYIVNSDFKISNGGSPEESAEKIIKRLGL